MEETIGLSQDAAIVLALAETAIPFATSVEDEAERWVRLLRLHGQVGLALQSLGVGEAPLSTIAQPHAVRVLRSRPLGDDPVTDVTLAARRFAPRFVGILDCGLRPCDRPRWWPGTWFPTAPLH